MRLTEVDGQGIFVSEVEADGNAAAVKEHGGHEESDLFGGGAGIESEEGWNSKAV